MKPKVFTWLDESKNNISHIWPANIEKGSLCWQLPSSPLEFKKVFPHFYERTFKTALPIECPINAMHTMMYLKGIPQRQT